MSETTEEVETASQKYPDYFDTVCAEGYDGSPLKVLVSAETTPNYKIIIEESRNEEFRRMMKLEFNRRVALKDGYYRIDGFDFEYSNQEDPSKSEELVVVITTRAVGIDDL